MSGSSIYVQALNQKLQAKDSRYHTKYAVSLDQDLIYKPRATGSLRHLMLKVLARHTITAPYRLNYSTYFKICKKFEVNLFCFHILNLYVKCLYFCDVFNQVTTTCVTKIPSTQVLASQSSSLSCSSLSFHELDTKVKLV